MRCWLAATDTRLDPSIAELLVLDETQSLPLREEVKASLHEARD